MIVRRLVSRGQIVVAVLALALSGGACTPARTGTPLAGAESPPAGGAAASIAERLIALDLANALCQLIAVDEVPSRLATTSPHPVAGMLGTILDELGFDIVMPDDPSGERTLRHGVATIEHEGESVQRHRVAFGTVELSRGYRRARSGEVRPASALYVRGADPAGVRMIDEQLFGADGGTAEGGSPSPVSRALPACSGDSLLEPATAVSDAPDESVEGGRAPTSVR